MSSDPKAKPNASNFFVKSGRFLWRHKTKTVLVAGISYLALLKYANAVKKELKEKIIDGSVLVWRINHGSIVESTIPSRMGAGLLGKLLKQLTGGTKEMTMLEALTSLEMAADDSRIKSLIVRVSPEFSNGNKGTEPLSVGLGFAQIQELRQALATFKTKKDAELGQGQGRTYFFIDSFDDQSTYYLASAFTDIIVQPTGYVPLTGLSSTSFYFKTLSEKIGVKMHVEARKDYKSVVAPFSQSSMPEKHRENLMSVLESLNDTLVEDIALGRGSDIVSMAAKTTTGDQPAAAVAAADIVRRAMEVGPLDSAHALNVGLITKQGYSYDVQSIVGPRKAIRFEKYGEQRREELNINNSSSSGKRFNRGIFSGASESDNKQKIEEVRKLSITSEPILTVGVVYLLGTIERLGVQGSHAIADALRKAALDTEVSAIVLRIDSGGGDVIASDTIAAAVDHVQQEFGKPVIASFGNVSASGAYYSSTSCKRIFASPGTITGSIGVAAMRPVITQKLLDFVGTNVEEVFATDNTSTSVFREPEGPALERYQRNVDNIYNDFTSRVAKGRGFSAEHTESVAQGKVFTGTQALSNGLVDEMGGFTRAIEAAAQLGHESRFYSIVKTVQYYVERINRENIHDMVAMERFKSVDEALKTIKERMQIQVQKVAEAKAQAKAKLGEETKESGSNSSVVDENPELKPVVTSIDPKDFVNPKPYKADILKNIVVKEFPESESSARNLISKIVGSAVSVSVSDALMQEINQLLAQSPNQVRAESDQTRFK
ncbi:hypothetical protein LPJ57_000211 [Coemansia sp. RSA 486]|nr:hypothetical protein LPJ57_000211 [Coemansia sp. RSA 486]KAJ2232533.1 hypothetical protein IWW45_004889 [Coemansia sp. RSA 485]